MSATHNDELHRLKEKVKKQDIALKEKEEALRKKNEILREKNDSKKWNWLKERKCRACAGTSEPCRHCWQHSTPEYIIDYASCTDPVCLKKKETRALKRRSQ